MPAIQITLEHDGEAVEDQAGEPPRFLLAVLYLVIGKDLNEGGRQCSFGKQVTEQIRNAKADNKRVVEKPGPKIPQKIVSRTSPSRRENITAIDTMPAERATLACFGAGSSVSGGGRSRRLLIGSRTRLVFIVVG